MLQKRCDNDNHGRAIVTVRFCANCGEVVNERILAGRCSEETHAKSRRTRNTHCVDCGERLLERG
jgi:DNA-directed RNA polymerase subunit RPC12/RpoP